MKYVLITGAFGGMGSKAVEEFVKRGYTVFALDNRVVSPEKASDSVIPLQVDITDQESIPVCPFLRVKKLYTP